MNAFQSLKSARSPLQSLALATLSVILMAIPQISGAADQPNVLFFAVDDLRDTLGCYGDSAVKTPHIDRLAARSVIFERAYVQYPVCNPSRSSFLTGLRPDETGVTDNTTLLRSQMPNVVTFPQLLKEHGWHSAAFGKIFHLGGGRNKELKGKWMDLPKSWHSAQAFSATGIGSQKLAGRDLSNGKLNWCHWGAMNGDDNDQPDGQIASAVITEMERLGDKPWIIGCGFMKPHDPFVAPKKYFDLYPENSLQLHRDPLNQTPAPPLAVGFGAFGRVFSDFTDTERMEFLRAYCACTSFMDAQVGRVMDALDRLGLQNKTLVVFVGDHGYHLGERDWWNKNTLFDRSCRAPLLISGPKINPGRAPGLVEFVDLFPTIAEFCGIAPPDGLAGQSLWPQLTDPAAPGRAAAFTIVTRGADERGASVRTDRWRFTLWSDGSQELYDHSSDPEETQNVAEANAAAVQELSALLQTQQLGKRQ